MSLHSLAPRSIRQRALAIGLPAIVTHQFLDHLFRWIENSGEEWTVDRLKSIRTDFVQLKATGRKPVTPWVSRTKSGDFKGLLGALQKVSMSNTKNFERVQTLLSVYTSYVASQLTKKQNDKFISTVVSPQPMNEDSRETLESNISKAVRKLRIQKPSPKAAGPFLTARWHKKSHESRFYNELYEFFGTQTGSMFMVKHTDLVYKPLVDSMNFRSKPRWGTEPVIGTIGLSQEPGYKARFFMAPHIWAQHVLIPLQKLLGNITRDLPWDGTHDQEIADVAIHEALANGKTAYCFDLSDATNNFPLDLQLKALEEILQGPLSDKWVSLFEDSSRFPVENHEESQKFQTSKTLSWKKGQPLGLAPSFASFALTHGLLVFAENGFKWNHDFFIIGDDIVILNEELATKYQALLDNLGIPFSPSKSLTSSRVAEFAGYLFHSGRKYLKPKWRGHRDHNILDIVRNNGPEYIPLLPKKVQPLVRYVASLPEPVGFGWNPDGLSLDQRISGLEELYWDDTEENGSYDLNPWKRISSRYHSLEPEHRKQASLRFLSGAFKSLSVSEQDTRHVLGEMFKRYPWLEGLPPNSIGKDLMNLDQMAQLPPTEPVTPFWKRNAHQLSDVRRKLVKTLSEGS